MGGFPVGITVCVSQIGVWIATEFTGKLTSSATEVTDQLKVDGIGCCSRTPEFNLSPDPQVLVQGIAGIFLIIVEVEKRHAASKIVGKRTDGGIPCVFSIKGEGRVWVCRRSGGKFRSARAVGSRVGIIHSGEVFINRLSCGACGDNHAILDLAGAGSNIVWIRRAPHFGRPTSPHPY